MSLNEFHRWLDLHVGADEFLSILVTLSGPHDTNHVSVSTEYGQLVGHIPIRKPIYVNEKFDDLKLGVPVIQNPGIVLAKIVRHGLGEKIKILFADDVSFVLYADPFQKRMIGKNKLELAVFCKEGNTWKIIKQ